METEVARQRGRKAEGGEHSSHAWSSGLVEWCLRLELELFGAFYHTSDSPFTSFVPFIRVCGHRVLECGLVIEEIVFSEPNVAAGGGQLWSIRAPSLTCPKELKKREQ